MLACPSWRAKYHDGNHTSYKESWAQKNWCFWTVVLEKTLESPLNCKEIQPVHPKGDQSWVVIGRTDAEAETPILWPPHEKSWLIGKDPDAGKDWRQEEKGTTEDEMVGWHHWLYGQEFGWTPGVGDRQGGLVCCGSWGCQASDMTEQLNWRLSQLQISSFFFLTERRQGHELRMGHSRVTDQEEMLAWWQGWLNIELPREKEAWKLIRPHPKSIKPICLCCGNQVLDMESPPGDSSQPSAKVEKASAEIESAIQKALW